MQQPIISAEGLSKSFEGKEIVKDISFELYPGELVGLLGPNGAGKTTTLRMLAGLLSPDKGEVHITGTNLRTHKSAARARLGFLTGDMALYRRLKPLELLTYFGKLYGVDAAVLSGRVQQLATDFAISDFADRFCEKLSTGQQQRVSIARTVIHDPAVIVLDEPTTGLDIMASELILRFMQRQAQELGKAVLFSTHQLDEVSRLCQRILVIHEGQLVFNGPPAQLMAQQQAGSLHDAFFRLVNPAYS
jgi:sodium transport system ATP-binding protein